MRRAEVTRLRIRDVDLDDGVLTVLDSKFGKDRLIPLHPEFKNQLAVYAEKELVGASDKDSPFFPTPSGNFYDGHSLYGAYRKFLEDAGISHVGKDKGPRLHDLRHTFAVNCLNFRCGRATMATTDFAKYMTGFLSEELPGQQSVSTNTIKSYRDTFLLLLGFCKEVKKLSIEKLAVKQFDADFITEFLGWLETERENSAATRNQRLAAIHAFFRYVQESEPSYLLQCEQVIAIGTKKHKKPHIGYLTAEQVKTVLAKPDLAKKSGRRDLLILSVLYDTGARVSELIDLYITQRL
ncbi:hypothetical protein AGMMS49975_01800 [Clostridia bacterium]|nr:hypothetical protein AGMMS49975_01800 [Clostridia bacterium]